MASADTVVFNVGGRHHEVLRLTIQAHPATLLANLLDDLGTDSDQPLFVDANPDRFPYILDWYRYGEIHVPDGCPTKAILHDARFFLLPDFVKINGSSHMLHHAFEDLHDQAAASVIRHWPSFEQYVTDLIEEVRREAEAAGAQARQVEDILTWCGSPPDEPIFRKSFVLKNERLLGEWRDRTNVCSTTRLKVLVLELTKRGLCCELRPVGTYGGVILSVGLGRMSAAKRVRIDGAEVAMGRLQVCSHNSQGRCDKCAVP